MIHQKKTVLIIKDSLLIIFIRNLYQILFKAMKIYGFTITSKVATVVFSLLFK